eukprot:Sspe_Gene.16615::Locus_5863_Transcript_1_1_Confidence_1.000_Length_637::g.16615::m.16615
MFLWSSPSGTIRRCFSAPHSLEIPPWRMGKDALKSFFLGMNGVRPQATGIYRQMWTILPSLTTLMVLQHYAEVQRWNAYLEQKTTFGDLARSINNNTLTTDTISATLDQEGQQVFGQSKIPLTLM